MNKKRFAILLLPALLLLAACGKVPPEQTLPTEESALTTFETTVTAAGETKLPPEYTWEEFNALSESRQEAFFEWFETPEAFADWRRIAEFEHDYGQLPWYHGGKLPRAYTWEEFLALSDAQQEMFFEWFDSPEDFESWKENTKQ